MPWIRLQREAVDTFTVSGIVECRVGHRVAGQRGVDDGVFAGWHWDGSRLAIAQDRYGLFPLFAWLTPASCALATDIGDLLSLGAPRTIDPDALAIFLRFGFYLGDDTPFASIRAVPPQACLTWHEDGPRLDGGRPAAVRHDLSREGAVDGFIDLFRIAIERRRPRGPYTLPLSGGKDSRHILLELLRQGVPPRQCATLAHFPPRANTDIAIARALSVRAGVPHYVIPQRTVRSVTERTKNARTHFCADEHVQWVALADYVAGVTTETYDGLAGDVLSQSTYLTPELQARFDSGDPAQVVELMLGGSKSANTESALRTLVAPRFLAATALERARARLRREIVAHMGAPNPIGSFYFWNRTRREIALGPYALMRDITAYAPYLDAELFDLLAGLPAPLLMDRQLHTDAIAKAYPAFADVPYESKGGIEGNRPVQRRFARDLVRSLVTRPPFINWRGILPGLLATAVDGHPTRLWHGAMTAYLTHLGEVAELS
jgi:asparagine synthase (glutamine-hydrolysing)